MKGSLESRIHDLRASPRATSRAVGQELSRLRTLVDICDHEMAMVRARRTLELLLRSTMDSIGQDPGTRSLDQVMTDLSRTSTLPPIVERHCRVVRDFGNLAAHSGASGIASDASIGTLTQTEVQVCMTALAVIVGWYCDSIVPSLATRLSFRVLSGGEIGLTQLTEAAAIDVHVYPPEFRGKPDVLLKWHRHNGDLFTLVSDVGTGKVVGCLTVLPLEDPMYAEIERGGTIDTDLPVSAIRRYDLPDFYKLYIASVVVDPAYHGSAVFSCLYEAYLGKLLEFAQRDIFVTEILADIVTPDGERLANFIGMKPLHPSLHGSTISKAVLLPPSLRVTTRTGRQLLGFYERKYEEFREMLRSGEGGC